MIGKNPGEGGLAFAASVALALTSAAAPSAASAQSTESNLGGYALNQLDVSPAGDDFFGVPSPHSYGHIVPRAYLLFDYAHDPLRLGTGESVVSAQGFLRADASLSLFDRLLLHVDIPVALFQSGDSPTLNGVVLSSPDSAHMGDLRLGARFRIAGADRTPFQLGFGTNFYFNTAGDDAYSGDGAPRIEPQINAGGRVDGKTVDFVWTASGGIMFRASDNPHTVQYGAGVALSFANDLLQVGPEFYGSTQIGDTTPLSSSRVTVVPATSTGLELLGDVKLRVLKGLVIGAAAGPGLTSGIGTPLFRVIGMVGWAPLPERAVDPDPDHDNIIGANDACPTTFGEKSEDPKKNGCPPPDRDNDKIADALDACPSLPGRANSDPTQNGCPADYDQDGVADADDACPNQKGVASVDPARNGCPGEVDTDLDGIADKADACPKQKGGRNDDPSKNGCPIADSDGDTIADSSDACPNEKGLSSNDPKLNGCPDGVRFTTTEIVILKQVQFRFGMSSLDQTIDPVSDDLLTAVRDVIVEHPEVKQIEVQGHTDDVGTVEYNQTLSEQRANAVRNWLIARGIAPERLVSRGYGATRPIATNQTEEGRQKNRRVQMVILKMN
ncbi:MAG: OmpA family protein [Polyangiaceae bacterium]